MPFFVTKYAFTQGIQEYASEDCSISFGTMLSIKGTKFQQSFHGEGRDWHRTEDEAIKRVVGMIVKERDRLVKKLADMDKNINGGRFVKVTKVDPKGK